MTDGSNTQMSAADYCIRRKFVNTYNQMRIFATAIFHKEYILPIIFGVAYITDPLIHSFLIVTQNWLNFFWIYVQHLRLSISMQTGLILEHHDWHCLPHFSLFLCCTQRKEYKMIIHIRNKTHLLHLFFFF